MAEPVAVMPIARVYGEPVLEVPYDLYIPPDALEVVLDQFEGPLDLLLYLIRKENINVLDIPMARLTAQYLEYVEIMRARSLELAAEYLLMAAMAGQIANGGKRAALELWKEYGERVRHPSAPVFRLLRCHAGAEGCAGAFEDYAER